MEKPAESAFPLHDLIQRRWSPVAFSEQPVERDKIGSLLEAARWAPSSFNEQPWVYFVATKDEAEDYQRLFDCLVEGNQTWAQHAPVLMLAVAQLNFSRNGKPNAHAQHDVGLANENLVLQATALGLIVHQMAGFKRDHARAALAIPDGNEPLTMLAAGYPGDISTFDESLQQRDRAARSRKPLKQMVFGGTWGQPASLAD